MALFDSIADTAKRITDVVSDPGSDNFNETLIDLFVEAGTVGFAGYNNGKLKEGINIKLLKDITGVTASEQAAKKAEEEIARENRNRYNRLLDERNKKYQADVAASNAAQAFRNTADVQAQRTFGDTNAGSLLGSPDETSFLGL